MIWYKILNNKTGDDDITDDDVGAVSFEEAYKLLNTAGYRIRIIGY